MSETEKDSFLYSILEEIDGFDGMLTSKEFYDNIVRINGSCQYSIDELDQWLSE